MKKKVIYISITLLFVFFIGCKPKQTISERIIYKADSTSLTLLKEQLNEKTIALEKATTDLERMRDEITTLRTTLSVHEIKYDTTAQIKPDGYYPIAHEVKTESMIQYENSIKEKEKIITELNKSIETLTSKNIELENEINSLISENKELKSKEEPQSGFNFRLFFFGVLAGAILIVGIRLLVKAYL